MKVVSLDKESRFKTSLMAQLKNVHTVRFELTRISTLDLKSNALDHSAMYATQYVYSIAQEKQ